MSSTGWADKLREEGNKLYKEGRLIEAIQKYREAARRAPRDSAPLRNLSAAFYELGRYEECITHAEQAMSLMREVVGEDMVDQIEKLKSRMEKAKAHLYQTSRDDQLRRRRKIVQILPRYRPNMSPHREFYNIGHDNASSLFDTTLELFSPECKQISFLLGGVGDARHMLATILDLAQREKNGTLAPGRYHFTLNDINNYAISRDLIIWMLIDELSIADSNTDSGAQILNTLVFVYFATMMPKYAFHMLHKTIDHALVALKAGMQPLKWVHLHKEHIPMYLRALEMWKGRALGIFTNIEVVENLTWRMKEDRECNPLFFQFTPEVCKKEKLLFVHTAVLYPSRRVLELSDPVFQNLLKKYSAKPKANAKIFKDHLQKQWRINTTLISPDFYDVAKENYDLYHDPFEAIDKFQLSQFESVHKEKSKTETLEPATNFYDFVAPFFIKAAYGIKSLEGRLQVEVFLGDIIDVCENLKHGLYQTEDAGEKNAWNVEVRPTAFPVDFDRIHLSNVPDYIGGHLSTFLHVVPILKRKMSSVVVSCCLRNTDQWDTVDDFIAEYQCITDDNMLERLTSVKFLHKGELPYPCRDYTAYVPANSDWKRSFKSLLPRKAFNRWFNTIYFKITLPYYCDIRQFSRIIYSPLNLTILFRLLGQLRTLGYPAHWLSEALVNILEDKVVTSARPPWKLPMRASDWKREYPELKLTTAPFRQELATLSQLFQPLLPFSLSSTIVPSVSAIHAYSFKLPSYDDFSAETTSLLLSFYSPNLHPPDCDYLFCPDRMPPRSATSLRSLLDPRPASELDSRFRSAEYVRFREQGIACWTTFEWDAPSRTAKAWMPSPFVDMLVREGWHCALWRIDVWWCIGGIKVPNGRGYTGCAVTGVVARGVAWSDDGVGGEGESLDVQ